MAFPTIVSEEDGPLVDANALNFTPDMPASLVNGNLLLAFIGFDGVPTISTVPTGWTLVKRLSAPGSQMTAEVYKRTVDGNEASQRTWVNSPSERSVYKVYQISGQLASGTNVEASTGASGTSTLADPDALTPTGGAKDYLWFAICSLGDWTTAFTDFPDSYSGTGTLATVTGGTTGDASLAFCYRQLNAASEDPTTFTHEDHFWVAFTLAVHPVASVAGGVPSKRTLLGIG